MSNATECHQLASSRLLVTFIKQYLRMVGPESGSGILKNERWVRM